MTSDNIEIIIAENTFFRLYDFKCSRCLGVKEGLTKSTDLEQCRWCDVCRDSTLHEKLITNTVNTHKEENKWEPVIYGGWHNTVSGYHDDPCKNKWERDTGRRDKTVHERIAPINYNASHVHKKQLKIRGD